MIETLITSSIAAICGAVVTNIPKIIKVYKRFKTEPIVVGNWFSYHITKIDNKYDIRKGRWEISRNVFNETSARVSYIPSSRESDVENTKEDVVYLGKFYQDHDSVNRINLIGKNFTEVVTIWLFPDQSFKAEKEISGIWLGKLGKASSSREHRADYWLLTDQNYDLGNDENKATVNKKIEKGREKYFDEIFALVNNKNFFSEMILKEFKYLDEIAQKDDSVFNEMLGIEFNRIGRVFKKLSEGRIKYKDAESWRRRWMSLLSENDVNEYHSIAWVLSPEYWADEAGQESEEFTYKIAKEEKVTVNKIFIIPDAYWQDEAIHSRILKHKQSKVNVWVTKEEDVREKHLLTDLGIYGERAVGYQKIDKDDCHTIEFVFHFNKHEIAQAKATFDQLLTYASGTKTRKYLAQFDSQTYEAADDHVIGRLVSGKLEICNEMVKHLSQTKRDLRATHVMIEIEQIGDIVNPPFSIWIKENYKAIERNIRITRIFIAPKELFHNHDLKKILDEMQSKGVTVYLCSSENLDKEMHLDFSIYDDTFLGYVCRSKTGPWVKKSAEGRFTDNIDLVNEYAAHFDAIKSKSKAYVGEFSKPQ